jgi:hypothetical protein
MQDELDKNNQEAGEEQLHELIKQAGNEARSRKKQVSERHLEMLQAAVAEGVARRKNPVTP